MELFPPDTSRNLLPADGEAFYLGPVFSPEESDVIFNGMRENVPWQSDECLIYGKRHITSRKVAWFADEMKPYRYSGVTRHPHTWSRELMRLKVQVELLTNTVFNSCLLNLYHHGGEGMGWHRDDEPSLVKHGVIASLSFGAERKFSFKHRETGETASVQLENGSLLVMKGTTQSHWLHSLPKTARVHAPRINLTFRQMV
jgi:alkylated DNA repair dioxygenase AlkB